jgi:hypothetical protein
MSSLFLSGVAVSKGNASNGGGFADIFRGTYGSMSVAIKKLRVADEGQLLPEVHQVCRAVVL